MNWTKQDKTREFSRKSSFSKLRTREKQTIHLSLASWILAINTDSVARFDNAMRQHNIFGLTTWCSAVFVFSLLSPLLDRELDVGQWWAVLYFQPRGGGVAELVERHTDTPLNHVRFPGTARDFSTSVNFQCRLSYGVCTPSYAIACIKICAHVKDPVTHVRFPRIMKTLKKKKSMSVGWVVRLCRSWFFLGKATRIFHGGNPKWDNNIAVKKEKKRRS